MSGPTLPPGVLRVVAVGSRATCNPPPTDTDRDWLVLVAGAATRAETALQEPIFDFAGELEQAGWTMPEPYAPADPDKPQEGCVFMSVRRGEDNLIVTDSAEFFRRFLAASSVAKRLNLLDKADRIALFQAVLYGNGGEEFMDERLKCELEELFA